MRVAAAATCNNTKLKPSAKDALPFSPGGLENYWCSKASVNGTRKRVTSSKQAELHWV